MTGSDPELCRGETIGLFGGSFNPAHDGHAHVAHAVLEHVDLDRIWWLVSPGNPLKGTRAMADYQARLKGAAAFTADHDKMAASDLEQQLGTRYSADTLRALAKRYPETHFVWIMGADNFVQLPHWRNWRDIMEGVPVVVVSRPGSERVLETAEAAKRYGRFRISGEAVWGLAGRAPPAWAFLDVAPHPASSSALRDLG